MFCIKKTRADDYVYRTLSYLPLHVCDNHPRKPHPSPRNASRKPQKKNPSRKKYKGQKKLFVITTLSFFPSLLGFERAGGLKVFGFRVSVWMYERFAVDVEDVVSM